MGVLLSHTDMKLLALLLLGTALASAARAPEAPDEVHFERGSRAELEREGRQSLLNCLMGCTRELRPVRGEQRGQEQIFANKCNFDIERCRTNRNRGPPLVLSSNQDNIVYPSQ